MKNRIRLIIYLSWWLLFLLVLAQTASATSPVNDYIPDAVVVCGSAAYTANPTTVSIDSDEYTTTVFVGQAVIGVTALTGQIPATENHSTVLGILGLMNKEPIPPYVVASDGDFPDQIQILYEQDVFSPVADEGYKIYRNNTLLATLPANVEEFQDFNVRPGVVYNYEVLGINEFGEGNTGYDPGFVNPNGVITGHIQTTQQREVVGAEVSITPNLGQALNFDGDDDCVKVADISTGPVFSVEMWVKFNSTSPDAQYLYHSPYTPGVTLFLNSANKFQANVGGAPDLLSQTVSIDTWYHVAYVYDFPNNRAELFVNGISEATDTAPTDPTKDPEYIIIGDRWNRNRTIDGIIDDVRLWSIALTDSMIQRNMNRTLSGDEDSLVAYWKFDEGNSDYVFDLTANDHDGRVIDGSDYSATWTDDIAPVKNSAFTDEEGNYIINGIYYSTGQTFTVRSELSTPIGRALSLDGVDDYVRLPAILDPEAINFTAECWFKAANPGDAHDNIIHQQDGEDGQGRIWLRINDTSRKLATWLGGSEIVATTTIEADTWYHAAITVEGTNLTIYLNGEMDQVDNITAELSDGDIILGAHKNLSGNWLQGALDEVRFWNVTRSQAEIQETMNETLEGNETGLLAYYQFNEGRGDYIGDKTFNNNFGTLMNADVETAWIDDIPLDEYFIHEFTPTASIVTLNTSSTATDGVDFVDISMIPVSGFVRYEGTDCFADSVEILDNGEPLSPPVYSDETGAFTVEFEPGTSHSISAYKEDPGGTVHTISMPDYVVNYPISNISQPITGLMFIDRTKRSITVNVVGGTCQTPLDPSANNNKIYIELESAPSCYGPYTFEINSRADTTITGLPPVKFVVGVRHTGLEAAYQGYQFDAQEVSLTDTDSTIFFVHREKMAAKITDFPSVTGCDTIYHPDGVTILPNLPILIQYLIYGDELSYIDENLVPNPDDVIRIMVEEDYATFGGDICPVDTGFVTIYDDVGGGSRTRYFGPNINPANGLALGEVRDTLIVGSPNILDGGDYPFAKLYQITAEDTLGRQSEQGDNSPFNQYKQWVYIDGTRNRENTFTSMIPLTPVMILRDPPGDNSFSSWETGVSYSFVSRTAVEQEFNLGGSYKLAFMPSVKTIAGLGVMTYIKIMPIVENELSITLGEVFNWSSEETDTWSVTESFNTSSDPKVIGESGDVYIGYASNIIYGLSDQLSFIKYEGVPNACIIERDTLIVISNKDIATTYIYRESHIMDHVIPSLETILEETDQNNEPELYAELELSIEQWNDYLILNSINKDNAVAIGVEHITNPVLQDGNVSFDAGVGYSFTMSTGDNTTSGWDAGFVVNEEFISTAAALVNDMGPTVKFTQNLTVKTTWGEGTTDENGSTWSFTLEDDDMGDFFSVDIKKDAVFGSPVFELVSGRSSCPWEEGTQPRDGVQLSFDPIHNIDVPPDEPAIYNLIIGNDSQSDEDRTYHLRVLQETNNNGATIRVNGVTIEDHLEFNVPVGIQLNSMLTLERGPVAYDGYAVQLMLYSPCQYELDILDNPEGVAAQFHDIVEVTANFIPHCSQVWLTSPGDNWFCGSEVQLITLAGYDVNSPSFDKLKLQYRTSSDTRSGEDGNDQAILPEDLKSDSSRSDIVTLEPIPDDKIKMDPARNETRSVDDDRPYTDQIRPDDVSDGDRSFFWVNIAEITKAELIAAEDTLFLVYNWDVSDLDDGAYEIRAIAACTNDDYEGQSDILTGIIERRPPALLGQPQPADQILNMGDEISVGFTEAIDCNAIIQVDDLILTDINTPTNGVMFEYSCYENQLFFTIDLDYNRFYENHTIRATVKGIEDFYENTMPDSIVWEFYVDRAPIRWLGEPVTLAKFDDETLSVTRQLRNTGGSANWYDFVAPQVTQGALHIPAIAPPAWMVVTPDSGLINPVDEITIFMTIYNSLPAGEYADTLYVRTAMGDERLPIYLTVQERENTPPTVASLPEPADGVLNIEEVPSLTFSEPINCDAIEPGDISLSDPVHGDVIYELGCADNQLFFNIALTNNYLYENHTLQAIVTGIEDLYQNAMPDTVRWEFYVNRNPVAWSGGPIETNKYEDETLTITRQLINTGAAGKEFTLTGLPDWLTAEPMSGTVYPNAPLTITFTIADDIPGGPYSHTILADTNMGDEPLRIDVNVICHPPDWTVNAANYQYNMTVTGELYIPNNEPNPALGFDGVDDYVEADDVLINNAFCVEMWVKFDAAGPNQYLFHSPVVPIVNIQLNETGNFRARVWNGSSNVGFVTGPVAENDTWYHLAYVYDYPNNQAKLFVNGAPVDSATASFDSPSTKSCLIGTNVNQTQFCGGTFDDIRIWSIARTQTQLQSQMYVRLTGNELGLEAYYPFSENTGTTTADASGNSHDGTLHNDVAWTIDSPDLGTAIMRNQISIGAFVGNELRGVGSLQYVSDTDRWLTYLVVYSNFNTGEWVNFRVWDGLGCTELGQDLGTFEFAANQALGTPDDPYLITLSSLVVETMDFAQGWTWFSLNLDLPSMDINQALSGITATDGDLIKNQGAYSQFTYQEDDLDTDEVDESIAMWVGPLDTLDTQSAYFIRLAQPSTVDLIGYPLNLMTAPIDVEPGWNWISYQPSVSQPVDNALSSLSNLVSGDLVKDQYSFAQYFAPTSHWLGSLIDMYPSRGYLLKVANSGTITYPEPVIPVLAGLVDTESKKASRPDLKDTNWPEDWTVNPSQFEHTMTLTGLIEGEENSYQAVAAFVDDECRGVATPINVPGLNEDLYFLMVYGQFAGEMVEYRSLTTNDEIVSLTEITPFEPNASLGNVTEPFVWTFEVTAIEEPETNAIPTEFGLSQNFPNPFNPSTVIRFQLPVASDVDLTVYNVIGQRVKTLVSGNWEAGYHSVVWNADNDAGGKVKSGVYFYRMTTDSGFDATRKLLLLK